MASGIVCTLLYDKWGAGSLGMVGSIIIIMISIQWRSMGNQVSLTAINVQMACIGIGVSMVLLSGALGTALAGDIHKAVLTVVIPAFYEKFIWFNCWTSNRMVCLSNACDSL
ncbi:hypothetical protein RCO48_34235 [Peribacillus frigoritolerans]|nr:hypothetical protein [Peribacillus frigoritolerans]